MFRYILVAVLAQQRDCSRIHTSAKDMTAYSTLRKIIEIAATKIGALYDCKLSFILLDLHQRLQRCTRSLSPVIIELFKREGTLDEVTEAL